MTPQSARSVATRGTTALAAALAGAAGLGVEVLLIETAGLVVGYGRAAALGLAVFLAGWAIGARVAASVRSETRRALLPIGIALAIAAPAATWLLLWLGHRAPATSLGVLVTIVVIALVAALQGLFLPLLARRADDDVWLLLCANWSGAALGAYGIADFAVGAFGRPWAAVVCSACALAAAALAAPCIARDDARSERSAATPVLTMRGASWIVGCATAAMAALEWSGLRLGVLWLGGMQPALRAILCASLVALGVGAALGALRSRPTARDIAALLVACTCASLWPFVHPTVAHAWNESRAPLLVRALLLVGPMLVPFGAVLPWLHRATSSRASEAAHDGGARLGRLLLHEAWGAVLGIPLVQWWIVPRFGLAAACAASAVFLASALVVLVPRARVLALAGIAASIAIGAWQSQQPSPALRSPPLSNPALALREFSEDRDFAVAVVDDGVLGERTLFTDGFRAAGTGRDYRYMRALGHLPLLLHPSPRDVAVLALGTGTTLGAVGLHRDSRIDVLEISGAVVEMAPHFETQNRGLLATRDRVNVLIGDGRASLAVARGRYDVLTMEPLLPDSPFAVYLYTREFYDIARRALRTGGIVCQWVPPHALSAPTFHAVLGAFSSAFPWSGVFVFGTQVILVGADVEPTLDPARFVAAGALADELAALGLGTPADVCAHYVCSGGCFRGQERALTDGDPWIVFAPRDDGPMRLADLPRNLGALRSASERPPSAWMSAAGASAAESVAIGEGVRRAREAHAWDEVALRAPALARRDRPADVSQSTAEITSWIGRSADARELSSEIEFLDQLRRGVAELASDASQTSARIARASLERALALRPERGDARLYLAVAYERDHDPRAEALIRDIVQHFPDIARTPEGLRARALGLSDERWRTLAATPGRSRARTRE